MQMYMLQQEKAYYNMFLYCGNNPVINKDITGEFFFTIIGAAIGAVTGGLDAWMKGDDILTGAMAGAVSGAIAGAGVDIGVAVTAATGGAGAGAGLAIAGAFGAIGSVVGTGISTDWEADPLDYAASAVVGGAMNLLSFGLAPINGEVAKGTITSIAKGLWDAGVGDLAMNVAMGTIVAEGCIWITRVITHDFALTQIKIED